MASKSISLSYLVLLFSCAYAFDISEILNQHKDFSAFKDLLVKTNVSGEINSRHSFSPITILVVDNSAVSSISGLAQDVLTNVLSVHVILEYYDLANLQEKGKKGYDLTTLHHAKGKTKGNQGFLKVTLSKTKGLILESEAPGSPPGVDVIKSVVNQAPNLSILQISKPIIPLGIEGPKGDEKGDDGAPSPPAKSPAKEETPKESPKSPAKEETPKESPKSPAKAESPKESPKSPAKAESPKESPKNAPTTTAPTKSPPKEETSKESPKTPTSSPKAASAPTVDATAAAPTTSPAAASAPTASGPAASGPAASAPAPDADKAKSAGVMVGLGAGGVFVIVASLILSLALMV